MRNSDHAYGVTTTPHGIAGTAWVVRGTCFTGGVLMSEQPSAAGVTHETPSDGVVYRHLETDDEVRYTGRTSEQYMFRINSERTMTLPVRDWPTYREFLGVDRNV